MQGGYPVTKNNYLNIIG